MASARIVLGPCACVARVSRSSAKSTGAKPLNVLESSGAAGESETRTGSLSAAVFAASELTCSSKGLPSAKAEESEKKESRKDLRVKLAHLAEDVDQDKRERLIKKYLCMPDHYYDGDAGTGPQELGDEAVMKELGFEKGCRTQLWELMAGSAKLSATARKEEVSHLPPVDHRWGFHVGRFADQLRLLYVFLVYGCEVLFASPTCTPWGSNSRSWDKGKLRRERAAEGLTLQFLTLLCFLQVVMRRSYLIENSKGSDMFRESPISHLKHETLQHSITSFDQCAFGAMVDGGFIKKGTDVLSSEPMPEVDLQCPGGHAHVPLQGSNKTGARTAQAAVYPEGLCHAFLAAVRRISTKQSGGRICINIKDLEGMTMTQSVATILGDLRVHAQRQGRLEAWDLIVTPWLRMHSQIQVPEMDVNAVLHLAVVETIASDTISAQAAAVQTVADLSGIEVCGPLPP